MKKIGGMKPGWIIVACLILLVIGRGRWKRPVQVDTTFVLKEGESIAQLYDEFSFREERRVKSYFRDHDAEVRSIQPGSYQFSGSYSPAELLEVFLSGPKLVYEPLTLLEGWSSYDVDRVLARDEWIEPGEYLSFIADSEIIRRYTERYEFLQQAVDERGSISTLEGYLYPDTYFVDPSKNIIDQLVYLQLEAFQEKIWKPYGEQLTSMSEYLQSEGYEFRLSSYGALILASVIEKEERYDGNKSAIASVFFNRLNDGMRLDADITLCYGIQEGYEKCTPELIVENLRDASNVYNTRMVGGLPPTPICTPSAATVAGLVMAEASDNYYYLHDMSGEIHLSRTLSEHNSKKSKYLQ